MTKTTEEKLNIRVLPQIPDEDAIKILGRMPFSIHQALLKRAVKGKTVCVTGAAGSIGSELCRQALSGNCRKLVAIDRHENGMFDLTNALSGYGEKTALIIADVREKASIGRVFRQEKPQIIFHAAAYKHVPLMQTATSEAIKNNILGTLNVLEIAEKSGAEQFILVSTDKAVNPSSVMGATKRAAEMLVQSWRGKTKCAAVRFGNVFGSSGSVVPTFIEQILSGQPLTVTDKRVTRYFMTISEAVSLILQAAALSNHGEIFVLDMGEPILISTLAERLIEYFDAENPIVFTNLRAGEKLFEQLRYDAESVDETRHEGIFVCKTSAVPAKIKNQITALIKKADRADEKSLTQSLFALID